MANSSWTREQVEDLLRRETFGYQKIALPHGLATPGDDRGVTARQIFPDDLTGKTVLDLGCNTGYFCFEAIRRGASRVVGYDHSASAIRRARLLAECLGHPVEFEVRDLNTQPVTETFDYVLCLNVIHHLDDPLLAIDQLVNITARRLALEMAGLSFHTLRRRMSTVSIWAVLLAWLPVIYAGRKPMVAGRDEMPRVKYFITPSAMDNIMLRHRHVFSRIERLKSEHKGRYLVLGHR